MGQNTLQRGIMADDPIPAPPISEPVSDTPPVSDSPPEPAPRRKVYQPTLFAERRRRRASPWLVIPGLLLVLGGLLYFLLDFSHRVPFIPTAGEVVYASDQGSPGTPHLWIAKFDGSGAHALLTDATAASQPAFSPNGSQIAFLSNPDGKENQVFLVDADGKGLIQLTRNSGAKFDPSWSPGNPGVLGYLAGGVLYDVAVTAEGAGGANRLLPPPPSTQPAQDAEQSLSQGPTVTVPTYTWSPAKNGGVAAVEDTGTFQALAVAPTLNSDFKDVQQTPQGNMPLLAAGTVSLGWNQDGTLLAVAALGLQGPQPFSGLFLFTPSGTPASSKPLTSVGSATLGPQHPVFSPDGTQVAFEAWNQPDLASRRVLGLALIPADGSAPARFLYHGDVSDVQFAPDGSALFFLAGRPDGGHDLCRVAIDGTGFQRLSDGHANVTGFSLSPQKTAH